MPDSRSDRRRAPARDRRTTAPGRAGGPGRSARRPGRASAAAAVRSVPRPRLTGRAAVLVLVLAVLAVSYASSARAYLQQRSHLDDLREEIAQREAAIAELEREQRRWDDPAYVKQQARGLGYVMPGETSYLVVGADGEPLEPGSTLSDPDTVGAQPEPRAWWQDVWESVELAGHPPRETGTPPLAEIDGESSKSSGAGR